MHEIDGLCDECGGDGKIGDGYGGYHVFECVECGFEWVER